MAAGDVFSAEMPDLPQLPPLDDDTVERLLAGRVAPDDAPPGYARVAALLRATAAPPHPDELAGAATALAAFRAARPRTRSGRRLGRAPGGGGGRRRAPARVAALVVAGALLAGGAATAGGALPVPVGRVGRLVAAGETAPAAPARVVPSLPPSAAVPGQVAGALPGGDRPTVRRAGRPATRTPRPAHAGGPAKPKPWKAKADKAKYDEDDDHGSAAGGHRSAQEHGER